MIGLSYMEKVDKALNVPANSIVSSLPEPPQRKTEEYLGAYTGYPYTAISSIAQEVASIDLHLFKTIFTKSGPETEEIFEHESLSVLHYCNPFITFYDMVEATQVYLELVGEAFWVLLRENENEAPKEIYMLRPDWVTVVPSPEKFISHYVYYPGGVFGKGIEFQTWQILHFKYFNPKNPYRGKGSIQAAAMEIDTHQFAKEWNRNFFYNSAEPGMVFTTDQKYDVKVIQKFMESWQSKYSGRNRSHKVAFLSGGFKLDKTSMTAKEMDFTQLQSTMRDDTLAVFKVPKTILGLTDDVNRANAEATTRAFMERVVTPRMRKFVGQLTEFFLPMFGVEGDLFYDFTDPAPEDQEMKLKRYANARQYGWLTANEVRAEENYEPVEGGDVLLPAAALSLGNLGSDTQNPDDKNTDEEKSLISMFKNLFFKKKAEPTAPTRKAMKKFKHMMPIPRRRAEVIVREKQLTDIQTKVGALVSELLKGTKDDGTVQAPHDPHYTKSSGWDEARKFDHWTKFATKATKVETDFRRKVVTLFQEEEYQTLQNLNSVKYWKVGLRKGKESSVLPDKDMMYNLWYKSIIPFIREILIDKGEEALDDVGVGGQLDLTTRTAVEFLRKHGAELIKSINETTREKLRATLADGFEKEESIDQLRKRIEEVYAIAKGSRSENIARTETIRASNFGTEEGYRQSGVVEAKEWLAQRDVRTCPFCEHMDGKVIGIGKAYFKEGDHLTINGETLNFDLLDVDHPPLHGQCRCTLIPVIE